MKATTTRDSCSPALIFTPFAPSTQKNIEKTPWVSMIFHGFPVRNPNPFLVVELHRTGGFASSSLLVTSSFCPKAFITGQKLSCFFCSLVHRFHRFHRTPWVMMGYVIFMIIYIWCYKYMDNIWIILGYDGLFIFMLIVQEFSSTFPKHFIYSKHGEVCWLLAALRGSPWTPGISPRPCVSRQKKRVQESRNEC